jgi:hypothetical protein
MTEAIIAKKFQKQPAFYITNVLGAKLENYQTNICAVVEANERTAIKACHSVGKSFIMARIVLWFASCFPYSKVITTAPTGRQVRTILWSEIRAGYSRAKYPLGGKMLSTEWQLTEEKDWFAIGFSPKSEGGLSDEQGTQSSFQGFHASDILVVFDEATGIAPGVWKMVEGLLTTGRVKFVCIGNPTSRASNFFNCFRSGAWANITLSCFVSPNLIANGITDKEKLEAEFNLLRSMPEVDARERIKNYKCPVPHLLSLSWVMSYALELGSLTHPLFVSKVLGEFPEEGENIVVSLGTVEAAQLRVYYPVESDRRSMGVDVARYGSDSTVLTYLHGKKFVGKKRFSKIGNMEVSGEVISFCEDAGYPDVINIDETGVGAGVVDALRDAQLTNIKLQRVIINGVQFGASVKCENKDCDHKTCQKFKYVNIKARMFDLLGNALRDGLCLPSDDIYEKELPTILYKYDKTGRLYIESKDEYKKRTGRGSPDHADSLALANYGFYDSLEIGSFTDAFNYSAPTHSGSMGNY